MLFISESTSNHTLFSIIIPSWNNIELIKLCIESVRKNSTYPHEIIVHVNDGSDGTLDWIKSQNIKYTHSPDNIGICLAVNQSAALATHNLILYLNDDMYCCPNWDKELLLKVQEIGHDAFVLSGTMIEPTQTGNLCVAVKNYGVNPNTFQEEKLLAEYRSLAKKDWLGATWPPTLVHRRWWNAVGGYSCEFSPGMSSDNDFSRKTWAAGCRIFLGVGNSLTYHFMCKSTGRITKNNGRKKFMQKWGMTPSFFDFFYLRRGKIATERHLQEPKRNAKFYTKLVASRLKVILASINP